MKKIYLVYIKPVIVILFYFIIFFSGSNTLYTMINAKSDYGVYGAVALFLFLVATLLHAIKVLKKTIDSALSHYREES